MDGQMVERFQEHFGKMKDPRVERTKLYPLEEILFVLLCGSICGAESWRDFVMFGQEKLDFLREYFPFSAGIPCKNTFARVSAALEPEQFRSCFIAWAASLQTVPGEVIAIDGKTLCNSANACTGAAAIHRVSAFGTDSRLVLAQQKVSEKSNEITAIAALLDLLDVTGHILTIDAMGCQRAALRKRFATSGPMMCWRSRAIKARSMTMSACSWPQKRPSPYRWRSAGTYSESDAGHGRVESRRCVVSSQIDWLEQKTACSGLTSIAMIEETREFKGRISVERRFFISSLPANARQIAQAVRAHWAIENTLHWTLDVVFNEDQSTVRKDHAPQNMAIVRHGVLNILNTAKKHFKGIGVKALRKKAGWGNENLRLILKQSF